MPNQRAAITMSPDEVATFLRNGRTAVLVTVADDGMPEPVGMWYVVDDEGTVWMRTYAASQKVVNIERDPRAALLVEEGDTYDQLRGVQLRGRIELSDDVDRICGVFAGIMVKYQGMDAAHAVAAREGYRAKATKQRALRFVVEAVVSWDHRKQEAAG